MTNLSQSRPLLLFALSLGGAHKGPAPASLRRIMQLHLGVVVGAGPTTILPGSDEFSMKGPGPCRQPVRRSGLAVGLARRMKPDPPSPNSPAMNPRRIPTRDARIGSLGLAALVSSMAWLHGTLGKEELASSRRSVAHRSAAQGCVHRANRRPSAAPQPGAARTWDAGSGVASNARGWPQGLRPRRPGRSLAPNPGFAPTSCGRLRPRSGGAILHGTAAGRSTGRRRDTWLVAGWT